MSLLSYDNYFASLFFFVFFFCVAQAPEVVCRDQRYAVLPLYFTRALGRLEYAVARLASLATAIWIVLMIPNIALFIGDVLMKTDTFKAVGDELPMALPAIPAAILTAAGLAAISLSLSSFTPRRAYAAIGIVAYVLLMEAIPAAIYSIGQSSSGDTWTDKLFLLTPITALNGATNWFFGKPLSPENFLGTLTADSYLIAALVSVALFSGLLIFRYRRIPA